MFGNHISEKELVSRKYKELSKVNNNKLLMKIDEQKFEYQQRRYLDSRQAHERYSTSLVIISNLGEFYS